MNILHVEQMLYYQRDDFSGLELYASHDWWVMTQNMHHSHLPRCHLCVLLDYKAWYTSILHTKWLLYHSRHSFSTLEPRASSNWKVTLANMYRHHFLIRHCILQAQVKTMGSYNTTTHQTTSLLPKMLHSMLKTSEKLQFASQYPVLTSLSG